MQSDGPDFRIRLAAVLGRMGSDHDGEVLNAARLANTLISMAGITWQDIVLRLPPAGTSLSAVDAQTLLSVSDPRHRLPPVRPPLSTWRNSAWSVVSNGWGTRPQQEYFTIILQGPEITDLWRPSWQTAQAIIHACKNRGTGRGRKAV